MGLLLVGSALLALVLGTGGAAGASVVRGPGTPLPGTWLGSYATFDGAPWVWCVDAGRAAPEAGHPWTAAAQTAPDVAYLLATYAHDAQPEVHAALSYLVHTAPDLPHDAVAAVPPQPPVAPGMDLPGRVAALRDEASRLAGPYTVPVSVELAADGRTGQVGVAVLSAAGHQVPGRPLVLRLDGPAQWAGGAQVLEATSTAGGGSWDLQATGDGEVRVRVEAVVPPVEVSLHSPGAAGVQRVVSARPPGAATGTASSAVRATFAPQVTTRTSQAVAVPGTLLSDLLEVGTRDGTSWPPGTSLDVLSTLWGPFDDRPLEADRAPQDAPVVGTVTTAVTGPGPAGTAALELPGPGYYTWTEQVVADERQTGWQGRFGVEAETTLARWQPSVTTRTSDAVTFPGAELRDHLGVAGLRPGASVVVASTLWGPFVDRPTESTEPPAGAPVVGTVETTVQAGPEGVGEATTGPLVVPATGWYVWTETISADTHQDGWASAFGRTSETTQVPAEPSPPAPAAPPVGAAPVETSVPASPAGPASPAPRVADRPAGSPVPQLAQTGITATVPAAVGVGLVVAGAGLLLATRTRRVARHRRAGVAGRDAGAPSTSAAVTSRSHDVALRRRGWVPQPPLAG